MTSLLIAHCGDLHIGAGYAHSDQDKGGVESRLVDFRDAWVRSCRQMVADHVNLVLIAGDGFRNNNPSPTEQDALRAGLDILCDFHIPVVAVTGNHDDPKGTGRTDALKIFHRPSDGVTVASQPQILTPLENVQIICVPTPSRAWLSAKCPEYDKLPMDDQNRVQVDKTLEVIRGFAAQATLAGATTILLAHGHVSGSTIGAQNTMDFLRGGILPLPELVGLGFAYQAWGHIHKAQVLDASDGYQPGRVRYCGSIERVDFAEADQDKGWWLVDLTDHGDPNVEWRSSSPRAFVSLDFTDITNWQQELDDSMLVHNPYEKAIVRVRYTTTPEVEKTIDRAAITAALMLAGAKKVMPIHGVTERTTTEASDAISEDTDIYTGWRAWAALQGMEGPDFDRRDDKVKNRLEVHA